MRTQRPRGESEDYYSLSRQLESEQGELTHLKTQLSVLRSENFRLQQVSTRLKQQVAALKQENSCLRWQRRKK